MTILIRAINQTTGAFGGVRLAATAALGATAAALAYSVKQAAAFQTGLTLLSTGAGESAKNLQMVGNGIKQISIDTATTTDDLLKGAFMIESAGYRGQNALNVLKVAAQGAKLENTDLGSTANTLTSLMHDYGMKTTQAAEAMSGLIQTEADGKMHMADLVKAMGNVLPLASALKISFPQIGAAIATMTNSGMTAQRATQNLNFLLRALANPKAAAVDAMQSVGLSAQQVKDTLAGPNGLLNALTLIETSIGKTFPQSSVEYTAALNDIMGGATGWNTAIKLSGQNLQYMQQDISNISGAMKNGATLQDKWAQVQGTFNFQLAQTKAALNVAAIDVGTVLIPVLERLLAWVTPGITAFTNWATSANGLQAAVNNVVGGITNLVQGAVHLYQAFQQGQPWVVAVATALTSVFVAIKLIQIEEVIAGWVNWFQTMREGAGFALNLANKVLPNLARALGLTSAQADAAKTSMAGLTTATQNSALQMEAASATRAAAMAEASAQITQAQLDEALAVGGYSIDEIGAFNDAADAAEAKAVRLKAYALMAEQQAAVEAVAMEEAAAAEVAASVAASVAVGAATMGISLLVGAVIAAIAQTAASGGTKIQQAMDQLGKSTQDVAMKQKAASGDAIAQQEVQQQAIADTAAKQQASAAEASRNVTRDWTGTGQQVTLASANARAAFILDQQKMADAAARDAANAASSWNNFIEQMHAMGIDPINGGPWNPNAPANKRGVGGPHAQPFGTIAPSPVGAGGFRQPGHATGIFNSPYGHWAMVGERGPELMYVPRGSNIYPSGTGPGGHTINVFVSTMAGSRAEVMRMVDLLEREIASRFRSQTPSFSLPGLA